MRTREKREKIWLGDLYLITDILTDETLLVDLDALLPVVVLPSEERETGDEQRDEPNGGDHPRDPADGPLLDVVDTRHRPVSEQQHTMNNKLNWFNSTKKKNKIHNSFSLRVFPGKFLRHNTHTKKKCADYQSGQKSERIDPASTIHTHTHIQRRGFCSFIIPSMDICKGIINMNRAPTG